MTLWDHYDISILKPPFRRVDDTVADSRGVLIRLREGAIPTIEEIYKMGLKLAVASFNIPEYVVEILRKFRIIDFFHYVIAEYHPYKERMVSKILNMAKEDLEIEIGYGNMLMIDDNDWTVNRLKKLLPGLKVLQFGKDIFDLHDILDFI
jgi:magnesium-dependent phosphatase-1